MLYPILPMEDRIIVEPIDSNAETVTRGGLYVPDITSNRPCTGRVLSVGSGRISGDTQFPIPLQDGDNVLYVKGRGTEIIAGDGKKILILDLKDVLAKLV